MKLTPNESFGSREIVATLIVRKKSLDRFVSLAY